MKKRALLSVSNKNSLAPFASSLVELGYEILSTGGTARSLREAGLTVIDVSDVTGFPEMMDGRVKTLHPAVHGALLARRDLPEHMNAIAGADIAPIDLVCVNLYPFAATVAASATDYGKCVENIDIGGPAMIRSGAKNHAYLTVVTSPSQYEAVEKEMASGGEVSLMTRKRLAAAAFTTTAEYDTSISQYLNSYKH